MQHVDLVLLHPAGDVVRGVLHRRRHHQPRAADQRRPDLEGGVVEGQRGQLEQCVALGEAQELAAAEQLGDVAVQRLDALGSAGGAGGEDDVAAVVGADQVRQVLAAARRLGPVQVDRLPGAARDPLLGAVRGQHEVGPDLTEHELQPVGREGRVHRDVHPAGLQDGQHADDHLRRALDAQAHADVRADPERTQVAGQPVGPGVQLGVGQRLLAGHQRDGLRGGRDPGLDQLVDGQRGHLGRVVVPAGEQRALLLAQQLHLAVAGLGLGGHRGEDPQVVVAHQQHLVLGEDVGVVVQAQQQSRGVGVADHPDVEREAVGLRAQRAEAVDLAVDDPDAALAEGLAEHVEVVVDEVDLEERTAAELALQRAERVAAVRQQLALGLEDGPHQVGPAALGQLQAQRHGVQEEPAHLGAVRLLQPAVGAQAHQHVRAAADQRDQPQVAGQHDRLERDPAALGQRLQPLADVLGQQRLHRAEAALLVALAPLVLAGPADQLGRAVRGPARQPAVGAVGDPVQPEPLALGGLDRAALGGDEVAVGGAGRLGARVQAVQQLLVDRGDLGEGGVQAPAVEDRVVLGDRPLEAVGGQQVDAEAQQQRAGVVEAVGAFGVHIGGDGRVLGRLVESAQVGHGEGHLGAGVHQLHRDRVAAQVEGGAQHRVPLDHPGHRLAELRLLEGSGDPQAVHVVVRAPVGVQLHLVDHADLQLGHRIGVHQALGQPLAVLGAEQGERLADQLGPLAGAALLHHGRQRGDGGVPEEVLEGEVRALATGLAEHLDAADRVAAQVEEVVVPAHPLDPEHRAPDACQQLLQGALRRHELLGQHRPFAVGCGQRAAVHLALRGERQRVQEDEDPRHHVRRQPLAEPVAQLAGRGRRAAGHQVADQVRALSQVVPDGHHALQQPGVGAQRALDLAEFDPVAAHFDLGVGPAQVLQAAVGAPAGQVAAAVERLAGPPAQVVGDEPVGGQLRAAGVAEGDAGPGDMDLAGHAHRARVAVPVEHVDPQVRQRAADLGQRPVQVPLGQLQVADVHRGLGDAVHVDQQRGGVAVPRGPAAHRGLVERLAAEHHGAQGEFGAHLFVHGLELAEGRGRLAQHGDPLGADQFVEGVHVAAGEVRDHHHPGAGGQRPPELPDREVEGEAVEERPDVRGAELQVLAHRLDQPGDVAVGHRGALGAAGGAGGEDHVAGAVGADRGGRVLAGGRVLGDLRAVQVEFAPRAGRHRAGGRGVGEHQRGADLAEHELHPVGGEGGVQRDVHAAGLQYREGGHHGGRRALDADPDAGLRAHPQLPQVVGERVGAGVQLRVAQPLLLEDQGHRPRGLGRPPGYQLVHGGHRQVELAPGPGGQPLALGVRHQLQPADRQVGGGQHLAQQHLPVVHQGPHGGRVEEVGGVLDLEPQALGAAVERPGEVVLGGVGRGQGAAHQQALAERRRLLLLVQREDHLDHRAVAQRALGVQPGHRQVEGQLAAGERVHHRGPRAAEQLAEARVVVQLDPQDQRVDEEADQLVELGRAAAGRRRAEHDVAGARVTGRQGLEGGQQDHVQARALVGGELLQLGQRQLLQHEVDGPAAVAQLGRTRPVGAQVQQGGRAPQRLGPLVQLGLHPRAVQRLALPERVVGVLHGQRLQLLRTLLVGGQQLTLEDLQGPAITGDVMEGQLEPVLLLGDPVEARAQHRAGGEVERPPGVGPDQPLGRLPVGGLQHRAGQLARGQQPLDRLAADLREDGEEHLVPGRDRAQRGQQPLGPQRAGETQRHRHVVGRAAVQPAVQEPQPLLTVGERAALLRAGPEVLGGDAPLGAARRRPVPRGADVVHEVRPSRQFR